jgi:hypothetical protein
VGTRSEPVHVRSDMQDENRSRANLGANSVRHEPPNMKTQQSQPKARQNRGAQAIEPTRSEHVEQNKPNALKSQRHGNGKQPEGGRNETKGQPAAAHAAGVGAEPASGDGNNQDESSDKHGKKSGKSN